MTSRISLVKLLREDMKRHLWLWTLSFLGFFLALPVFTLMELGNRMDQVARSHEYDYVYTIEDVKHWYMGYVSFDNIFIPMIVVAAAVIVAIVCFSYLHSRVKMDFYHSFPVKREKLFAVQYIHGVLLFAVPYLLNLALALLIGMVNGVMSAMAWKMAAQSILMYMVYFLLCYTVAVIAMLMTGKIIVGIFGTAVFYVYGPAVWALHYSLQEMFYDTFSIGGRDQIWMYLSPVFNFAGVFERIQNDDVFPWRMMIGATAVCVILIILAVGLYKVRNSEAAETAMAFVKTESVIKAAMLIPASLAGGIFLSQFVSSAVDAWIVFGIIFCLVIGNGIVEFIYHMDFRELFKHKKSFIIACALTFLLFLTYRFDLTGYDSYLPEEDQIEEMAVFEYEIMGEHGYPNLDTPEEWDYGHGPDAALSYVRIEDYASLYQLVKNARNVMSPKPEYDGVVAEAVPYEAEAKPVMFDLYVRYYLKNGREVDRCYNVPIDSIYPSLEKVYENQEFRTKALPGQTIQAGKVTTLYIEDIADQIFETKRISTEQVELLLNTYWEEYMQLPLDTLFYKMPFISFEMDQMKDSGTWRTYSMNVYEDCPKTLALLKEIWPEMKTAVSPEDVEKISITWEDYENNDYESRIFADPDEIQAIIETGQLGYKDRYYYYSGNEYIYAEFYWTDQEGSVSNYRVDRTELPQFVLESFGK